MSTKQKSKVKSLPPTPAQLAVSSQARIVESLRALDIVKICVESSPNWPRDIDRIELSFEATTETDLNERRLSALMLAVASMLEGRQ